MEKYTPSAKTGFTGNTKRLKQAWNFKSKSAQLSTVMHLNVMSVFHFISNSST